jgi:GMP synthase-like glutamine amidotransferase
MLVQGGPPEVERRTFRRPRPDVVIWEADGRPLPRTGYGARIARAVRLLGVRVAVVPYRDRLLTEDELAAPVHLLSGGETSAFADDPATLRAREDLTGVLGRARAGAATVVGICLGAQLVARALDPGLPRSEPAAGMEAGMRTVYGPDGPRLVAELHYEQIHPGLAELGGLEITHTNAHSAVQGFRYGPTVFGYQFHPEWDPADMATVLRRHRWLLASRGADLGTAHAAPTAGDPSWGPTILDDLVITPVAAALGLTDVTAA